MFEALVKKEAISDFDQNFFMPFLKNEISSTFLRWRNLQRLLIFMIELKT